MEWRELAACAGMPAETFYPKTPKGDTRLWKQKIEEAKAICNRCVVKEECLLAGMREEFGIWGGMDEKERKSYRRQAGVKKWPRNANNL